MAGKQILAMRGVVVLFCMVAAVSIIVHRPKEVVMTMTARGWVPQKIHIEKWDTVVFQTNAGEDFWPASDSHPTHTLYPEFDPKRPLSPDEKWRFTFSRAGVWSLHDHLSSNFKGTIIVEGRPGEARRECLSRIAIDQQLAPACWEGDIVDALKRGGLEKAFDTFDSLYENDPQFKRNCHDVSHILGAEAYKLFLDDRAVINRPEVAYCGYGFYHGFIEAMFVNEGASQYNAVRAYCETTRAKSGNDSIAGPCFHGIGHAIFDSLDGSLWGDAEKMADIAILGCEKALINPKDRIQCSTGVYNSLGNAIVGRNYYLSNENTNAITLCKKQKKEYQYGCIVQAGIGYIQYKKMSRSESLQFAQSLGPELAIPAILTYIDSAVLNSISTFKPSEFSATCLSLPNDPYRQACIQGVISALHNLGSPKTEHLQMFEFCAQFPSGTSRTFCYRKVVSTTKSLNVGNIEFDAACKSIQGENIAKLCS